VETIGKPLRFCPFITVDRGLKLFLHMYPQAVPNSVFESLVLNSFVWVFVEKCSVMLRYQQFTHTLLKTPPRPEAGQLQVGILWDSFEIF
jgi:hypothetical protein